MGTCFVIQPFDNGKFDKRYESVFDPALSEAGLIAYRVDRDPSVSIPIHDIESGIRTSDLCFADITTDNPNVWFELGFSIAVHREVVLVCSDERDTKFPFDVQHRNIIRYATTAPQDFEELKPKITARIKAIQKKNVDIGRIAHSTAIKDTEGLSQHELVALVTVMQNSFFSNGYVSGYTVKNDMNNAGFTDIAVSISLKQLIAKGYIISDLWSDRSDEPYSVYKTTETGDKWVMDNQEKLTLKVEQIRFPSEDLPF